MHGSKVEYVVQRRLQDYWIDCFESTFKYKDQAESRIHNLREHSPQYDFQIVKRTSSFVDEILLDKA